ncbi:MAG: MFS transporter, partial [Halobacteriales archaeon]|nr:MFS transporter [Halobacteriales archaeon]
VLFGWIRPTAPRRSTDRPFRTPVEQMVVNWRYRHTVLALAIFANFSQFGSRLVISPVVPQVIATFNASKSTIGLALTGMWAIYALIQFPSGVLGDRIGERTVILASLGLMALGSLLLAGSPTFLLFALFALLLGAGTGLYFSVASSLLTKLYRNTGQVLSLHTAGGSLAGLVVPVVAAFLAVRFGWRSAVLLGAAVALPMFGLSFVLLRRTAPARPDTPMRDRFQPRRVAALLSRPDVAFTTGISFITTFSFQSYASFFPTFLIEFHGLSTQSAGVAFGAVFLLSTVVQPFVGRLSDRISRDTILTACFLTTVTGLGTVLSAGSILVVAAGVGILGIGMSWFGVLQARLMDLFEDAERGGGFGLVRTVFIFLGAFGSVVTGTLADVSGWPVAYGTVILILAIASVALVVNRLLHLEL